MATNLGQLAVKITADLKELSTGLTKAVTEIKTFAVKVQANLQGLTAAFKSFGSSVASAFESLFSGIYNTIKRAMKYIVAALVAAGIAAVKLAADAHESEEMFSAAMGGMEESARAFSDQLAKSLRLNPVDVRKTIAEFQNLLTTIGYSEKTAAEMSETMTQLGYDIASLRDTKPEAVFDAMQSAMVGNGRSMRQFGVLLDDTTLKTWALNHQIYIQGGELTNAQKSAINYAIILEKMGQAQGHARAHMNEGRAVLKSFWDQLKITGTEIGEKLLPVVNKIAGAMRDWLGANGPAIADTIGRWIESFGRFVNYLQNDWQGALLVVKDMVVAVFELMADSIVAVIMSIGPRLAVATKAAITDPLARMVAIEEKTYEIRNTMLEKMWKLPYAQWKSVNDVSKEALAQATKQIDEYISNNPVDSKASQAVTDNLKKRLSDIYDFYLAKIKTAESRMPATKGTYGAGDIPTTKPPAYLSTGGEISKTQSKFNELDKGLKKLKNEWEVYLQELKDSIDEFATYFANKWTEAMRKVEGAFSNFFYDIIAEGKSWKDALQGFADDMLRTWTRMMTDMAAREMMAKIAQPFGKLFGIEGSSLGEDAGIQALNTSAQSASVSLQQLSAAAQSAASSMGGGGGAGNTGGGWGSLFDNSGDGGNGNAWSPESSSPSDAPITNPEFLRAGGIVGMRANIKPVPVSVFANAPRARMGLNLEPDAIPIIAHRGERVLTAEQNRDYSQNKPSNININVSAIDAQGTYQFLNRNSGAIASMVQKAGRYNHPSRRSQL